MANLKYPIIEGKKKCGKCGEIKDIKEFYKHKNFYRSYCKLCQNKSTQAHRNNPVNKEKWKGYSKNRYNKPGVREEKYRTYHLRLIKIKKQAVEYKGGKCVKCGYNKCLSALEFHHINPLEKDKLLNSRGINRRKSFKLLKVELDKCVLVCANCHREIHSNYE